MSIPSFVEFFRPVLEAYREKERRLQDVSSEIGESFNLSEEEKREMVPSRRQTKLFNRVSWAKTYLTKAGLLRTTKWGHSEITDRGLEALESKYEIDIKFLKKSDSFQESRSRRTKPSEDREEASTISDEQSMTPEESIEQAFNKINESLAEDLLIRIRREDSQFLERLIVDLLMKMGYGDIGEITGGPRDHGLDGVILQDRLGIDKIYLQAKLYAPENKIAEKHIRDFSGSLQLKNVKKGVFVTTSSFTDNAINAAETLNIIPIDANKLADLMIEYNVGCQVDKTYEMKKIDLDYFESD
ncbi:restriction endonuclease [Thioalkalivibrio sp. HK1]|uniref:restriction endonuclease n=1 Tax=Thioalkalivibrio sp. HK1 TaxID=1469245 RepID=UPI00046EE767|nr:restriction endonuclease [Thioalkalivibrio sp. HK1]